MTEVFHADMTGDELHDNKPHDHPASEIVSGTLAAARLPDASTTAKGAIEIATQGEVDTGTDTVRAVTPDTLSNYSGLGGGGGWTAVDASETVKGIAELATQAEVNTGTDDTRIVTPLKLKTNVDLHINDATDAHDASAISIADSANQYTATNVEDALAEVLDGLQAHEADSSDAHDASAISFSPAGTIAATTVQGAIEEVASEAGGGGGHRTLVTLGSDVTNSTISLADVTGLSFSVTNGTIYRFYALIYYTVPTSSIGAQFALNAPAQTLLAWQGRTPSGATTSSLYNGNSVENGSTTPQSAATSGNIAIMEGIIQPSASGTFQIRFHSEVATNAVVVKAGSTLEYW